MKPGTGIRPEILEELGISYPEDPNINWGWVKNFQEDRDRDLQTPEGRAKEQLKTATDPETRRALMAEAGMTPREIAQDQLRSATDSVTRRAIMIEGGMTPREIAQDQLRSATDSVTRRLIMTEGGMTPKEIMRDQLRFTTDLGSRRAIMSEGGMSREEIAKEELKTAIDPIQRRGLMVEAGMSDQEIAREELKSATDITQRRALMTEAGMSNEEIALDELRTRPLSDVTVRRGLMTEAGLTNEQIEQVEQIESEQQKTSVAQQQEQIKQGKEEGRSAPTPDTQRATQDRRDDAQGKVPDPNPAPVTPSSLPPQVLSKPAIQNAAIKATSWNGANSVIQFGYIPLTFEQSVAKGGNSPHGRFANMAPQRGFVHPWLIQPFWDPDILLTKSDQAATGRPVGAWCAFVNPGLVNGHPPAIYVRRGYLPPNDVLSVYGNDYGNKELDDNEAPIEVLLTDSFKPFIKFINFADSRAKVTDANGVVHNGEVPLFFRTQGAFAPEKLDESDIDNNILIAASLSDTLAFQILNNQPLTVNLGNINKDDGLPEGTRYLFRADVVLQVDRPALKQNFEFDDVGLLRLTGFDVTLPTRTKYGARLYTVPIYHAPKDPTLDEVTSGAFNDRNFDEVVIGTAYFLSPDITNLNLGTDPNGGTIPPPLDGSWNSWVSHQVFWNLNYCSITQIDPVKIDTSLDYFKQILSVLAGGAGYLIAISYVNPIEAEYNKIETALNQSIVRGAFWTG